MGIVDEHDPGYGPLVDTTVRIATWNLWGTYGPWEARQAAIVETVRAADADVYALQEVWSRGDGSQNQADVLAAALGGYHVVYEPNLDRDAFQSGNAIVSRWPLARRDVRVLPRKAAPVADDEGEERLCVFAEIDGPRGPFQIFCAHLSWRGDHSAIRQDQVRAICEFVRDQRPRSFPAVLCGDLNADPSSDEIRTLTGRAAVPVRGIWFRDAWEQAGGGPGHTRHHTNPWAAKDLDIDRRIDFVMVGNPKLGGVGHVRRVELFGDNAVDGVVGSDHYGVVADLRY